MSDLFLEILDYQTKHERVKKICKIALHKDENIEETVEAMRFYLNEILNILNED